VLLACGENKPKDSRGGLSVIIDTDMAIPREIDRARVEIRRGNQKLEVEDSLLGPGQELVPWTIRADGKADGTPITVHAIAYHGAEPELVRDVITPFPSGRVAELRILLNWLCKDTAERIGEEVVSTCPDGQSCVEGACETNLVPTSTLPTAPPAGTSTTPDDPGNGGASGAGGEHATTPDTGCFDVLTCFASSAQLFLDRSTCSAKVPEGVAADSINLAIKTGPDGSGICDDSSCYAMLDRGGTGWRLEDEHLVLPPGVCKAIDAGKQLTIWLSTSCTAKTPSTQICASWTQPADPIQPLPNPCSTGAATMHCGHCGTARRQCVNGNWTDWGECDQGACDPGSKQACGDDRAGSRSCTDSCTWTECVYEPCAGPHACEAGEIEPCGSNGKRTCSGQCSWGACECEGSSTESCGNCGTHERTCESGTWSDWGKCTDSGECKPGATSTCGNNGARTCSQRCAWESCEECSPLSKSCGNCGTRTRSCENGVASEWSACTDERECAAGDTESCGSGGTRTCDDDCEWGSCTLPCSPPPAITAVTTGDQFSCALTSAGNVHCWGNNGYGQLGDGAAEGYTGRFPAQGVLSGVSKVAAGRTHACALTANHGVRCWGGNDNGELGDGTTLARTSPASTDVLTNVTDIALGVAHSCALTSTGGVRCWGSNAFGELGNGSVASGVSVPTAEVITNVASMAAGDGFTCALTKSGGVRCWGDNGYGQLGTGGGNSSVPPSSDALAGAQAVCAGSKHVCALTSTGGVRCWGSNSDGQLGDGTNSNRSTPPASDVFTGAKAIACGRNVTCALTTNGSVRCWGDDSTGQLGDGADNGMRSTPPNVAALSSVQSLATGPASDHACAITTTGSLRCWGYDSYGQTGQGPAAFYTRPVETHGVTGATGIAAGYNHNCIVTATGGVRCWGENSNGQLGDGTNTDRAIVPTADALADVVAVTGGFAHTCVLTASGGVRCWGLNSTGQLGDGTTVARSTSPTTDVLSGAIAVAAGAYHTCAIMQGGGLRCWGDNSYGQLGDGSTSARSTPPASDVLTEVVSVSAGERTTCALLSSGGVRCWGSNQNYVVSNDLDTWDTVDIPPTADRLTDVMSFASGRGGVCALRNEGVTCWGGASASGLDELWDATAVAVGGHHACAIVFLGPTCWGSNGWGQLGDGTTTDPTTPQTLNGVGRPLQLALGDSHTCALDDDGSVQCWGLNMDGQLGIGLMNNVLVPSAVAGLEACP
jgi:alpha-tubulin suppressor-like RCC1 family protein